MSISKISVRYAKALFQAAQEAGKSDEIYHDVKLMFETCLIPEFYFMLNTPVAKPSMKNEIIQSIFTGKVDQISLNFLELVTKNKRESVLKNIARNYLKLHQKFHNIKDVRLVTSVVFDEKTIQGVITAVEKGLNSKIELSKTIDTGIIGGFILKIENTQYDESISSKLLEIKRQLLEPAQS
jgi:F-type H+-transporting ATPase subunit delta